MEIVLLDAEEAGRQIGRLADILCKAVEGGALVGFVMPFDMDRSEAYWHGVVQSVAAGERLLLAALIDGEIAGTVQLYLSPEPNAPHRGEVFKLLVHNDFQRQRIGEMFMLRIEDEARRLKRSLLLLDTAEASASERLYRKLGWQEIGIVPHHFVDPFGKPKSSIYFMRFVD